MKRAREHTKGRPTFTYNAAMNPPFKTVGLIGKYKSPEIAAPLLQLGDYLARL